MIDHKATGKLMKQVRDDLLSLARPLFNSKGKRGATRERKALEELFKAQAHFDRARSLLDSQYGYDDPKGFDSHTYYGMDNER